MGFLKSLKQNVISKQLQKKKKKLSIKTFETFLNNFCLLKFAKDIQPFIKLYTIGLPNLAIKRPF